MRSEIIVIYKKEEEIKEIINKIKSYSFDELDKHFHFEFSLMEKLTDEDKLKEVFPQFGLIKSIELRENEKGQRYYGLNYELEDGTFVVISLVLNGRPMIINGFHAKRSYKKFEESLKREYSEKFK